MRRYIALIQIIISLSVAAQVEYTTEELFKEGNYFFQREDYKEALYFFKQLRNTDTLNPNFNFKVGECYLNLEGNEFRAVPYFEQAITDVVPKNDYKPRRFDQSEAPLHAYFYLGNAYRAAGELAKALKNYQIFIESPFFIDNYNQGVVEREMKSCERAKIIQDSPIVYNKNIFSESLKISGQESHPVLSSDGKTIVFMSKLKFYNAVYISRKINGKWQPPKNINAEIVSDGEFYPTGLSNNGNTLLLVRTFEGQSDIYISTFNGLIWSRAIPLPGKVNTKVNETFAAFVNGDNKMVVVSDRQSGIGGKDIFFSTMKDSMWSKPKNLGKVINTEFDEESPSFCRDGKTIFFSSKSHFNMGGFDIFYSNNKDGKWSVPKNIGYPINTTNHNLYYMVNEGCRSAIQSIYNTETGEEIIEQIVVETPLAIP